MPSDQSGKHPWDYGQGQSRNARESVEGHRAFRIFLELGRERSHARLANLIDCKVDRIKGWSSRYCWSTRIAAYDAHQATLWSKEAKEDFETSHKAELIKFKREQQDRAEKLGRVADQLITITSQTLADMIQSGEPVESQQLAAVARTAAALAEAAMNTAATALGVDDLIEAIEPERN